VVTIPATWRLIPESRSATAALARRLRRDGQPELAKQYSAFYQDDYQWTPPSPLFHAFQWPAPPLAVTPDVLVRRFSSGGVKLADIAAALTSELRKTGGSTIKVSGPVHMQHSAEDSYRIEATTLLNGSYNAKASFSILYLYLHNGGVYEMTFRGEAGAQSGFATVADRAGRSFLFAS
jgi:hypothetical protein